MLVLVRGGGDIGSGIAHRLRRADLRVVISELPQPLVIRRTVAFASAVYEGRFEVEGLEARVAVDWADAQAVLAAGMVPVVVDSTGQTVLRWPFDALVDARLAKRNLGTSITDAPLVIGVGPGFVAGRDVQAVVETMRGHNLGRVILAGSAEPDTHVPGLVQGYGRERVLWSPSSGAFRGNAAIGQRVEAGQIVAHVAGTAVPAPIAGVLRGILHDGLVVSQGQKVGDIDPRGQVEYCHTISDKARAIAGGVLEALLCLNSHHGEPA